MRQDERRQEFRYEEEAKAAKLAHITADKSALLARMVTAAVGKHAGLSRNALSNLQAKGERGGMMCKALWRRVSYRF